MEAFSKNHSKKSSMKFLPENRAVYEIMCTAGQGKDDNMAHALCTLDN